MMIRRLLARVRSAVSLTRYSAALAAELLVQRRAREDLAVVLRDVEDELHQAREQTKDALAAFGREVQVARQHKEAWQATHAENIRLREQLRGRAS